MRRNRLTTAVVIALSSASLSQAQEAIDLGSLDGSDGFVINGIDANDNSGRAVSGAGDVNGDGIDDAIIGAIGAASLAGEGYVLFGTAAPFPASIDLATLNGANGFVIDSIGSSVFLGSAVSDAGDINGDGTDDVIIGAYGIGGGQSYVLFGTSAPFPASFDLTTLNGANGFVINGIDAGDNSGRTVSTAGDVNGDGIDDIIVGAFGADPGGVNGAGESYVLFGTSAPFPASIDLATLNGSNGFVINGIDAIDNSGRAVSAAGDINGDGVDDVIIGAIGAAPGGVSAAGESYVLFGTSAPFPASIDLATLNGANGFVINGIDNNDTSGRAVSAAGDINGDGIDDVIISADSADPGGAANAGESYVLFGTSAPFPASIDLATLNGSNGLVINGIDTDDFSGHAVSAAGDINGDGIDDIIIGALGADPGGVSGAGESYVLFGTSAPFPASIDLATLNGANGFVINGIDTSDTSGRAVSAAGDINGDGIDDIIIGAFGAAPGGAANAGESYIVFGNQVPLAAAASTAIASIEDQTSNPQSIATLFGPLYMDPEPMAGIAIVANTPVTSGIWQYSLDSSTWDVIATGLDDSKALVLEPSALLRFIPTSDFSGNSPGLSARLWDGRWRSPGEAVDIANAVGGFGGFANDDNLIQLSANIAAVNDAPSFSAQNPPPLEPDAGAQTIVNWATFDPGAPNESSQTPTYQVTMVGNPALFSALPSVDVSGTLTYTPAPGAAGNSLFLVQVMDDGGTANGGQDTAPALGFSITVLGQQIFSDGFE